MRQRFEFDWLVWPVIMVGTAVGIFVASQTSISTGMFVIAVVGCISLALAVLSGWARMSILFAAADLWLMTDLTSHGARVVVLILGSIAATITSLWLAVARVRWACSHIPARGRHAKRPWRQVRRCRRTSTTVQGRMSALPPGVLIRPSSITRQKELCLCYEFESSARTPYHRRSR